MKTFRSFFIPCLLYFGFASCNNAYKNLKPIEPASLESKTFSSIFKNQEKGIVFNSEFQYKSYFMSGLMVIKKIEPQHFRVVFTAKAGTKVLDFELTPSDFKVNYSIAILKRKIFLKLLEKDMRLICDEWTGVPIELKNLEDTKTIYRHKTKGGWRYLFFEKDSDQLNKIERGTKRKKKVIVNLEDYKEEFPESITFAHPSIDLTMKLERL